MSLNPLFLGELDSDYDFMFDDSKREYKEHFIAFLDVLGFKKMIMTDDCNELYSIMKEVKLTACNYKCSWGGIDIAAFQHIHYRILSDSIILFVEADIDDSFAALVHVCKELQVKLASLDKTVLLRGGISKGKLYYEMDIIYGSGLTEAYFLESSLAKYPRIVFLGETFKAGIKVSKYMYHIKMNYVGIKQDVDEVYYINYLGGYSELWKKKKEYFDKLINTCENVFDSCLDVSVREKYVWLNNKIKLAIDEDNYIKEMYDKEKEEKDKLGFDEFMKDLKICRKKLRESSD